MKIDPHAGDRGGLQEPDQGPAQKQDCLDLRRGLQPCRGRQQVLLERGH